MIFAATFFSRAEEIFPSEVREVLKTNQKFELLSLDPGKTKKETGKDFFGYYVLGKTRITDTKQKNEILNSISNGIAQGQGMARCFDPRHGVRVESGTNVVDFLICFECGHLYIFSNKHTNWLRATTSSPQTLLNETLKKAKVQLPKE